MLALVREARWQAREHHPPCRSREGAGDAVFLPLGIWAAAELSGEDMCVEVGVLAGDGSLQTASRRYDGGKLSKVLLQRLVRST